MNIDQISVKTGYLLKRFSEIVALPPSDSFDFRIGSENDIVADNQIRVFDVMYILNGLNALESLETPDFDAGSITPRQNLVVQIQNTRVYFIVTFQYVLYRVLFCVQYLNWLVSTQSEFRSSCRTERKYVTHCVYYFKFIILRYENFSFYITNLFLLKYIHVKKYFYHHYFLWVAGHHLTKLCI